jgi:hypothetical protein
MTSVRHSEIATEFTLKLQFNTVYNNANTNSSRGLSKGDSRKGKEEKTPVEGRVKKISERVK